MLRARNDCPKLPRGLNCSYRKKKQMQYYRQHNRRTARKSVRLKKKRCKNRQTSGWCWHSSMDQEVSDSKIIQSKDGEIGLQIKLFCSYWHLWFTSKRSWGFTHFHAFTKLEVSKDKFGITFVPCCHHTRTFQMMASHDDSILRFRDSNSYAFDFERLY